MSKYAMVITNKDYDKRYTTLGDLPSVVDDNKNTKHTIKMMDIPPENTIEIRDARKE